MTDFLRNIPETVKGILLVLFGSTLLLHTWGILTKQLDLFIIGAAVIMLIYGFIILNGPKKVASLLEKSSFSDSEQK